MEVVNISRAELAVLTERNDQRVRWGDKHDDEHTDGALGRAGASYAIYAGRGKDGAVPLIWPFKESDFKPRTKWEDLVRAAALLLSELDRMDRAGEQ